MTAIYTVYSGIDGDFEDYKTIDEAHKSMKECILDGDEIHPDAESVILYKKIGHVIIEDTHSTNNCKIILPVEQMTPPVMTPEEFLLQKKYAWRRL